MGVMYGVGLHIHGRFSSSLFVVCFVYCPGQPGCPRRNRDRLPRITGLAPTNYFNMSHDIFWETDGDAEGIEEELTQRQIQLRTYLRRWHSCNVCGWWGYLGTRAKPSQHDFFECSRVRGHCEMLCSRCLERRVRQESERLRFIVCCMKTGFGRDEWFRCTVCGWWAYFGDEGVPERNLLYFSAKRSFGFELLCHWCKGSSAGCQRSP